MSKLGDLFKKWSWKRDPIKGPVDIGPYRITQSVRDDERVTVGNFEGKALNIDKQELTNQLVKVIDVYFD